MKVELYTTIFDTEKNSSFAELKLYLETDIQISAGMNLSMDEWGGASRERKVDMIIFNVSADCLEVHLNDKIDGLYGEEECEKRKLKYQDAGWETW